MKLTSRSRSAPRRVSCCCHPAAPLTFPPRPGPWHVPFLRANLNETQGKVPGAENLRVRDTQRGRGGGRPAARRARRLADTGRPADGCRHCNFTVRRPARFSRVDELALTLHKHSCPGLGPGPPGPSRLVQARPGTTAPLPQVSRSRGSDEAQQRSGVATSSKARACTAWPR